MVKRGKASFKDMKPTSANQKKGANKSNSKLKPGARGRTRNNKALVAKSCTDLGKKRVAVVDVGNTNVDLEVETNSIDTSPIMLSPVRFEFSPGSGPIDIIKQNNLQRTPKTPRFQDFDSESRLESLPMDLLVKILCNLHHDQLRPVFHVSQKIRKAVIHARQWYFNYTTPDRARQEMLRTMTPLPTDRWPFVGTGDGEVMRIPSPSTPKAPRHGPRPLLVSTFLRAANRNCCLPRACNPIKMFCATYFIKTFMHHGVQIECCSSTRMNYARPLSKMNFVDCNDYYGFCSSVHSSNLLIFG